jgi:hypothetical protein
LCANQIDGFSALVIYLGRHKLESGGSPDSVVEYGGLGSRCHLSVLLG